MALGKFNDVLIFKYICFEQKLIAVKYLNINRSKSEKLKVNNCMIFFRKYFKQDIKILKGNNDMCNYRKLQIIMKIQ